MSHVDPDRNGRPGTHAAEEVRLALAAPGPEAGVEVDREAERRGRLRLIDSARFAAEKYPREWLVEGVLVRGQPAVFGGPRKALKTSLLVDLAVSLAAPPAPGGDAPPGGAIIGPSRGRASAGFLGRFAVPATTTVGFFSGESGPATLQETARRVCESKGVGLASLSVLWGTELPHLADDRDLAVLGSLIREHRLGVVIVDPAYLALLAGAPGLSASNLYHVGPVLAEFSRVCLDAGATPILAHHAVKHREAGWRHEPLELEELAFAGVQEFARQWCLVARRARYEPGTGLHRLWLGVGGSAGFSGLWGVDVDEGVVDSGFGGRGWDVSVATAADLRQSEEAERDRKRLSEHASAEAKDREAILRHLRRPDLQKGDSLSGIAQAAGKSKAARVEGVVDRLVGEGVLVSVTGIRKGNRTCDGFRLADPGDGDG